MFYLSNNMNISSAISLHVLLYFLICPQYSYIFILIEMLRLKLAEIFHCFFLLFYNLFLIWISLVISLYEYLDKNNLIVRYNYFINKIKAILTLWSSVIFWHVEKKDLWDSKWNLYSECWETPTCVKYFLFRAGVSIIVLEI